MSDDMPEEIYALSGRSDTFDGVYDTYQWSDQCGTKYIRADLVPQWQPMETAPEDGSEYLITGLYEGGDGVSFVTCCNIDAIYPKDKPTHWMPLPQNPIDK